MSIRSKYCQVDEFDIRQSPLTGRSLKVNRSGTKLLIAPEIVFRASAIAQEWMSAHQSGLKTVKHNKAVGNALRAFSEIISAQDFATKIDHLLEVGCQWEKSPGQKNHIYGWLLRLWSEGILAIPREFPFTTKTSLFPNEFMLKSCAWMADLQDAVRGKDNRCVVGIIFRVAGRTMGICEPGDIVPETMAANHTDDVYKKLIRVVSPLLTLQRNIYGEKATYSRASWSVGRAKRKVGVDRSFSWVIVEDPTLSEWQKSFTSWLQYQRQGLALRTYMVDRVLRYLIENPHLPRSVAQYCSRDIKLSPTWIDWVEIQDWAETSRNNYTNYLADFFAWYLMTSLTGEDDFGRPVISPIHYNPITRQSIKGKQAETHREALPLRYLHELIKILTENDYAWPKSLRTDYFMWKEAQDGNFEKIWNPVRTYALLVKLMLPLRTYQVRMLDSGESDSEKYHAGQWARSNRPFASTKTRAKQIRRGFLRKFSDSVTAREFTGFFVNTNKTADTGKDQRSRGYEIPWQHEDVIRIADELRAWQEKYNPISVPTPWQSIHDKTVLRSYSNEMLQMREPACFLFRDACGMYPSEPVLDSRLQTFWSQLLQELENRVLARGERLSSGESIQFVTPQSGGNCRANYDLHTLRVSLITAYATEGGVPIQILSKCVAGHATILMTLYYNKPGPAYVSEQLADAQQKLQRVETDNFLRFLQNEEIRAASPLVVSNDATGISALEKSSPGSWVVGDMGICPVGGSLCHKGGPVQNTEVSKPHYSPVPGGPKNCVRCRFFITGPAFLGGLVARFNSVGIALTVAAERLQALENEICRLEDGLFDKAGAVHNRQIGLAYERRDRVLEEVDGVAHAWHANYRLIERCKAAIRDQGKDGGVREDKLSLVLAGGIADLRVALSECTDFDLYDSVCQRANIYPNENILVANLRRGRLLDAMLARSGRKQIFAELSETEALAVGNQFVELLMARVGRMDTNALVEGKLLLDELGIAKEMDFLLNGNSLKGIPMSIVKKKA